MRLFPALFRRTWMPNGHIWRGKDRLVRPVTMNDLNKLKNSFEIEEKNMFLLRNPYLSVGQSHGHTKCLDRKYENYLKLVSKKTELKDNITIESQLGHLRHKEAWD